MKPIGRTFCCMVLSAFLFLPGCVILGKSKEYKPFETAKLEELKTGESTASDVLRLFGAPSEVVKLSNGNAYVFQRTQSKGTGLILFILNMGYTNTHHDRLVCFFNDDDVLTHYGVTMDADNAAYGLP